MEGKERIQSISVADTYSEIPLVRVAVSNVVWKTNGELIGILSKSMSNDRRHKVWLMWWWAQLYGGEQTYLKALWAFQFEWTDARFKLPLENLQKLRDEEWNLLILCEHDVIRELLEELCIELTWWLESPILTRGQLVKLRSQFEKTVIISDKDEQWNIKRWTNYRIVNVFNIEGPSDVIAEMQASPAVYSFTQEDIENGYVQDRELKSFIRKLTNELHQDDTLEREYNV